MIIAIAFLKGLLAVIAVLTTITVVVLSVDWVVNKVKERLAANKRHKVVFADLRETVDEYIKKQKDSQEEYSMDDLERMCQEAPYVFADYDIDTGEVLNYTGVDAETIDSKVKNKLKERGGIVVFDS